MGDALNTCCQEFTSKFNKPTGCSELFGQDNEFYQRGENSVYISQKRQNLIVSKPSMNNNGHALH